MTLLNIFSRIKNDLRVKLVIVPRKNWNKNGIQANKIYGFLS